MKKDFEHAILLTGGIATGKSTVCKLLKKRGFEIVDADKIAHTLLDLNAKNIAKLFGEEYVVDGKVDRKALGGIIFGDDKKRAELEELLHPQIYDEIVAQSRIFEGFKKPYILDIPLFFEGGKRYDVKRVVLVYAPREEQKKRLKEREGLGDKEIEDRLNAQLPIDLKREMVDFIIDNSGRVDRLEDEVDRFVKELDASFKI